MESSNGNYSGIGAMLSQDYSTGIITVVQVFEGSPAEEVGLQPDDILYKVKGEEVTGTGPVSGRDRSERGRRHSCGYQCDERH